MGKPRLLDLFSGAGGAARGYQLAGFYVVGVDNKPQKHYIGEEFILADALEYVREHGQEYDAIHASPPCQAYSALRHLRPENDYPDLIAPTRELLQASRVPYIIENVPKAPLRFTITLCGSGFGLRVRRHRRFESSICLLGKGCDHRSQGRPIDVSGTGGRRITRRTNDHGGNTNKPLNLTQALEAMGIDWMTRYELSQAIPPAYCEFIGKQLMRHLEGTRR